MREPSLVAISIDSKFVSLELRIEDRDLVESVMHGLAKYVRKDLPYGSCAPFLNLWANQG